LLRGDPVTLGEGPRPLVLAFYYPWYTHGTWLDLKLRDRSLYQYSTEYPEEIAWSVVKARGAGLDALIVSWVGDTDWNDRRLGYVLDEAQKVGLKVAVLVETLFATDFLEDGVKRGPSAEKMERWLEQAFVEFGHHPAFLKVRGKPVVFVYVTDTFTPAQWRAITGSLQRAQRRPFLMADSLDPAFLESFDGEFSYATSIFAQGNLVDFYSRQALKTQSYHVAFGGERRVAAATVSPGYDDTLLDRTTTAVIDRRDGAFYDAQWEAAMSAAPDWILVTSWNEFFENTHVEPSELYGHSYVRRTRAWTDSFRR
jgi:Glycosyl hydrolase family 99